MRRPVALSGNRLSLLATAGLDRWSSKTELGLQTALTFPQSAFSGAFLFSRAICGKMWYTICLETFPPFPERKGEHQR